MVNVLFTATVAAADRDEQCSVVAIGNESQYLELQRSSQGLYVEVGSEAEPVGLHAGVECISLSSKRLELCLTPAGCREFGSEARLHIPLRLSAAEVILLRERLREITVDLIAFDEALVAAA